MTNEPAFPLRYADGYHTPGLTKREYFAGFAMQGAISSQGFSYNNDIIKDTVDAALLYADALLEALNESK